MKKLISRVKIWHDKFFGLVSYLQSPFLLWGKLHHLSNVTEFFSSLGLPAPAVMAVAIACLEFFGGIMLALGLLTRPVALVLTINLIMAYVTADREALFSIFSDPDKFYAAAPYTFLIASLIVLLFGGGKITLDNLLGRLLFKPEPNGAGASQG